MAPKSELQRRSHVVAVVTGIESRQHRRTDSHLRLGRSVGAKVIFGPLALLGQIGNYASH